MFCQSPHPIGVSSALLAQSVERETLSAHDLKRRDSQYISRLRVRPPRRACTLSFCCQAVLAMCVWVVVKEFLVADVCGGAMRKTTTTTSPHYTLLYNYTLTIFSAQLQTLLLLITFFFLILIYARQAKRALAYKVASKLFCRRAL
jgi:uncharacterized membrane protein